MNLSKKITAIIILILYAFVLCACNSATWSDLLQIEQYSGDGTDNLNKADYDILDSGPVSGGTLNLFSTEPDTLNPLLTKNIYVADFLGFIYEGLTYLNEKQKAVPLLSDEWTVSDDGLTWNFHIREGVRWHDGQNFTAEDVEFTFQTLMTPGINSVYSPLLHNISTFAAVDSYNFKIILKKPNFFTAEMMTFPILPKHLSLNINILSKTEDFKPVGTGPYKFVSYAQNKNAVLTANDNWWYLGAAGITTKDSMYIKTININIFRSYKDAMAALQEGKIDVAEIKSGDFEKYNGRTDLVMKKYTSRDFEFLALNINNPILEDIYVRKAITLAIDKDRLVSNTLLGEAVVSDLPVMQESWINDAREASSAEAVETAGIYEVSSAKTPDEALEMGGWKKNQQGYYKVIGGVRKYLKLEVIVNKNNSVRANTAREVCNMLQKAGIDASCVELEWNEYLTRLNTSKFDIAMTGVRVPQIPDISFLYSESYISNPLPIKNESASNISGYFNLEADENIAAMYASKDPERVKEIFNDTANILLNDSPYIGLYFLREAMVYSRNIRGPLAPYVWKRYNDIIYWYKLKLP